MDGKTIQCLPNHSHNVKVKERIVLCEIHLRTTGRHLSMGSHSVICHPTEVTARLHPNRAGWYSIYRPRKDERLSWPSWLVTYRNGLPVHRRWGTFIPNLDTLGLWVLELFAMYATDRRTDKSNAYCPLPTVGGIINTARDHETFQSL